MRTLELNKQPMWYALRTGKTEIVADLGHLWAAAEKMSGRACDPLSPEILDRLDRRDG